MGGGVGVCVYGWVDVGVSLGVHSGVGELCEYVSCVYMYTHTHTQ